MPFNPNIPQPTDNLSDSQDDLLQNNIDLNTSSGINHYSFSNATVNNGKHTYLQFPEENAPASTGALELLLHNMASTLGGTNNLGFVSYDRTVDATTKVQMTRREVPKVNPSPPVNEANGYSWLPGGFLIQYGFKINPGTSGTITFPTPFTSTLYNVSLTPIGADIPFVDGTPTTTTFSYGLSTGIAGSLYWFAIGN